MTSSARPSDPLWARADPYRRSSSADGAAASEYAALEEVQRAAIVVAAEGPAPGGEQVRARLLGERVRRLVGEADGETVSVRFLEVIAEDLLHFRGAALVEVVEPRGEPFVQGRPRRLRDGVVGGVADQDVAEPESVVAGGAPRARSLRDHEVLAEQLREE